MVYIIIVFTFFGKKIIKFASKRGKKGGPEEPAGVMVLLKERINTRLNRLCDILRELIGDLSNHQFPVNTPVFILLIKICDIFIDFWDLFDKSLPERERVINYFLELESDLEDE